MKMDDIPSKHLTNHYAENLENENSPFDITTKFKFTPEPSKFCKIFNLPNNPITVGDLMPHLALFDPTCRVLRIKNPIAIVELDHLEDAKYLFKDTDTGGWRLDENFVVVLG